jgi:hypothetical protein
MATELLLVNPRRKTRRKTTTKKRTRKNPATKRATTATRRVRSNPRRSRRRIKRNPTGNIVNELMTAGTGAAGAIGIDLAFAYMPIPEQFKTGVTGTAAKMATAVGAGMILRQTKVVKKAMSDKLVAGSLTVLAYDLVKSQLQQFAPDLPLGEYMSMGGGSVLPYAQPNTPLGYTNAAMGVPMSMGEYMPGNVNLSGEMDYYREPVYS